MQKIVGILGLVMAGSPALAQDLVVYGGGELEFYNDEFGPGTGSTSYVSAYVEADLNGLYAGVLGTLADDEFSNEIDLYFGYRNETSGGLSYGLGVTRYYYPNDSGSSYTELFASLGLPVGDRLSTSLDLYYDTSNDLGSAYVGVALAATDQLSISANFGTYQVSGASNEQEWDLGATYSLGDTTSVDLRYYDGSEYLGDYFGLSLTFDTTLLGG